MNFKFVYFWDNQAAMFEASEGASSPVWKFNHDFLCVPLWNKLELQSATAVGWSENKSSVQYDSETVIKSLIRKQKSQNNCSEMVQ